MRLSKDCLAGLMFMGVGIGAIIIARDYTLGVASRMGSGYFPTLIGGLMAVIGILLAIRGLLVPQEDGPVNRLELRPLFFLALAVVAFGLLMERAGLVAALAGLIVIARLAGREGSIAELAAMVVILSFISISIFVLALNVRLNLWPW